MAISLLAAAALVELAIAGYAALTGGFQIEFLDLPLSSSDPWKPFLIGVLCACLAGWLLDRRTRWLSRRHVSDRSARLIAAGVVVAVLVPVLAPVLSGHGFIFGHDVSGHATYTYLFDRALRQGQFPVRWVEWIEPGRGQPLFNYYQVGLYYLVEGIHLLGPSLSLSLKLTVVLFWAAGAAFMFLLFARYGPWSAVVAAIVFAWSRYLMLNGYVRAAYPELVAIGLAPGVLWSLDRFARTGRDGYLCAFAVLSALLTICHPPTALIIAPVCGAYVVYLIATRQAAGTRLLWVLPAGVLAVGLTAFFTWPALSEMDSVYLGTRADVRLDYHEHFVFPEQWVRSTWSYGPSVAGPDDQMFLRPSRVQFVIIGWALAVAGAAAATRRLTMRTAEIVWWLAVMAFALFMSTGWSLPVWEAFPPLAFVLFPWRYMMLLGVAGGALAALVLGTVGHRATKVALVACLAASELYLTRDYRRLTSAIPQIVMNIDDPDWATTANARSTAYVDWAYQPASVAQTPRRAEGRWRVIEGVGEIRERLVADHHLALTAATDAGVRVRIATPFVSGWIVRIDGQETPITVDPKYGDMEFDVPPGRHDVEVRFTDTRTRHYSNLVSILSGVLWLGWASVVLGRSTSRRRAL